MKRTQTTPNEATIVKKKNNYVLTHIQRLRTERTGIYTGEPMYVDLYTFVGYNAECVYIYNSIHARVQNREAFVASM